MRGENTKHMGPRKPKKINTSKDEVRGLGSGGVNANVLGKYHCPGKKEETDRESEGRTKKKLHTGHRGTGGEKIVLGGGGVR